MEALAFTKVPQPASTEACTQLLDVAKHYNEVRGFSTKQEGTERLLPVWEALQKMEQPTSHEAAKERVTQFVEELRPTYNQNLVSAASKFLWMRFGSPIVIYDSIVSDWMCDKGGCPQGGGYGEFYDAWQRNFEEQEGAIRAVCDELKGLSAARKFFDPGDIGQQAFDEAVSSRWFAERVFDHALLNAKSLER